MDEQSDGRRPRTILQVGALRMDVGQHKLWIGEARVADPPACMFRLLKLLMRAEGDVVPHAALPAAMDLAYRRTDRRLIKFHMSRLRELLGRYRIPGEAVRGVRGVGYSLEEEFLRPRAGAMLRALPRPPEGGAYA